MKMVRVMFVVLTAVLMLAAGPAFAQSWPVKPVRIVHGFGPGGPVDIIARMLGANFSEQLGQQAIVEGKPGAGGTVGAAYIAKAEPDGYVTSPRSGYASVQDVIRGAKAEPGKIHFGTGGVGSGMHLAAVLLQARGAIQMNHIPYKSGNELNLALFSGEIPVAFTSVAGTAPLIQSGKMRMLAVTSKERYAALPNVPTVSETLLPGFDVRAWYALAAPKKLPAAIVSRLNEAAHAALNRREFGDKLLAMGFQPWPTSAREAQEILGSEVARWTKVIRDEKIQSAN